MGQAKRFNLSDIPGAREHNVQYMMFCGVHSVALGKKLATDCISDLNDVVQKVRDKRISQRKAQKD